MLALAPPEQPVSLYPGGIWGSHILTTYICQNKSLSPTCYGQQAGLFNPDKFSKFNNHSIALYESGEITTGVHAIPQYGFMKNAMDNMDIGGVIIPNVTIMTVTNTSQTYPRGQSYPVEVGILSPRRSSLQHILHRKRRPPAAEHDFYQQLPIYERRRQGYSVVLVRIAHWIGRLEHPRFSLLGRIRPVACAGASVGPTLYLGRTWRVVCDRASRYRNRSRHRRISVELHEQNGPADPGRFPLPQVRRHYP
ncbi:Aspartic protease [Rasamsonia emersonii CBS 393.64]|uniref:Aspartic protease n=1 Tax=Rasamsonia emersonii (strain ATCC 16479 / CBS 393.64 / IMI 116815) TaxID=1408163 RepID=A0A0F4YD56_RASE3|nr:Aspartic protease [Rasamsonia emersonii CBS 393.64]KKA16132.1 Aspartic protease [Rasamsonia emersonii CBS 393.64]